MNASMPAIRRYLPTASRYIILAVLDIFFVWLAIALARGGFPIISIGFLLTTILITAIYTIPSLSAYRWMAIGLALMLLFTVYPILYTFYLATTNTSQGHILTKVQAIERLENQSYLPDDGTTYGWTAFEDEEGEYVLWLQAENEDAFLAKPNEPLTSISSDSEYLNNVDEDGIPLEIDGLRRLERRDVVPIINSLGELEFGIVPDIVRIKSINEAATLKPRYEYNEDDDSMLDLETDVIYRPDNGTFKSDTGERLVPGFFVNVGSRNFNRFFSSSALQGPLASIVVWNFTFAIGSVFFSFALGLFIAVVFDDDLPGKQLIRALIIIPYPIPALVSILIWRNLLNPDFGIITDMIETIFGTAPNFLANANWARIAVIFINVWLSYPYFYIISSGALQAIPRPLYDAASVDGAGIFGRFRHITLPLLLGIVSPLLIASFSFNFNNFNIIYIFNQGRPPIPNTPVPAGHTDILISFIFKMAFASPQPDYGLASAISIVLFFLVAVITWLQFRYTKALEDHT